jgi:peptidoglycan hydrolase-like protein with peptidoglycan-binding domain
MNKRTWICFLGAVLLLSAAPVYSARTVKPSAASKTTTTKKKTSTSKKKGKSGPRGQTAPTSDRVREIQTALQQKGSFTGEPNGKWDDATVNAMKKYQAANNLSPTGKIDAQTLNLLGLGAETAGKGAPRSGSSSAPPL